MFADNIKRLRESKNMSQAELAKEFNVAQQTVGKWEKGITTPPPEKLKEIATYFNCSIDYLMEHESPADTIRSMLGAEKPDPKKELLYALIRRIPHKKIPEAQALLEVLARDDYNNMA